MYKTSRYDQLNLMRHKDDKNWYNLYESSADIFRSLEKSADTMLAGSLDRSRRRYVLVSWWVLRSNHERSRNTIHRKKYACC